MIMTDITPVFNSYLKSHGVPEVREGIGRRPASETVDEFLKEAYRIVCLSD